jgi:hypothetical protein
MDARAVAEPLLPATRLLAISDREIFELDRDGLLLRTRPIPEARNPAFLWPYGAAMTGRQHLHLAIRVLPQSGGSSGVLMTLDLASGTYDLASAPGYEIGGLVGAFGIAAASGFVFAPNFGGEFGTIRFDLAHNTYTTLPHPEDPFRYTVDVSRGLDGRIHTLTSGLFLTSYDPTSLALVRQIVLAYGPGSSGIPIRGVVVDADGKVFAGAGDGQILRFSATGRPEQTVKVPDAYSVNDAEIDTEGHVLFGGDKGLLIFTDRALSAQRVVQLPTTHNVEIVVVE